MQQYAWLIVNVLKTYSCKVGDGILIRDKKCRIVGILNSSIYSGIAIPYQTMKDIYQNKEKIQFTGTFWGESNNLEKIADKGTKIIEKNDPKSELISTTTGMELYKNALTTKKTMENCPGTYCNGCTHIFLY